jgi:hypothetical protein
MRWHIGPWRWVSDEDGERYEGPEGTVSAIDFRSIPEQSIAGNHMSGVGLFRVDGPTPSEWEEIGQGNWHDIKADKRLRDLFPRRARRRLDADDLIGLIRQSLNQGDPTGQEFCKPLMPGTLGTIEVSIAGQRHAERFQWGRSKESNVVRDIIRADMDELIERCGKEQDERRKQHHRRVLDMLCERYGVDDWKEFVKPNRVKDILGRLPHETSLTDDFTRADQTGLGTASGGWSWGSVTAGINIVSNRARSTADNNASRAESDLSSADHYAESSIIQSAATTRSLGVRCRYAAAANTAYEATSNGVSTASFVLKRIVAGVATTLSTVDRGTTVTTRTTRITVSGSNLDYWEDGVSKTTATDTNITGNLRCGIGKSGTQQTGTQEWDDFVCSDGAAGGILYTQLERGLRGVTRGVYTDRRGIT